MSYDPDNFIPVMYIGDLTVWFYQTEDSLEQLLDREYFSDPKYFPGDLIIIRAGNQDCKSLLFTSDCGYELFPATFSTPS